MSRLHWFNNNLYSVGPRPLSQGYCTMTLMSDMYQSRFGISPQVRPAECDTWPEHAQADQIATDSPLTACESSHKTLNHPAITRYRITALVSNTVKCTTCTQDATFCHASRDKRLRAHL
jgi:hypothetical protein